jgi:hypothetical protein
MGARLDGRKRIGQPIVATHGVAGIARESLSKPRQWVSSKKQGPQSRSDRWNHHLTLETHQTGIGQSHVTVIALHGPSRPGVEFQSLQR